MADDSETGEGRPADERESESGADPTPADEEVPETDDADGDAADVDSDGTDADADTTDASESSDADADGNADADTDTDADVDAATDANTDTDGDATGDGDADTDADSADDSPGDDDTDLWPEADYTPDEMDDPAPDADSPEPNVDDAGDRRVETGTDGGEVASANAATRTQRSETGSPDDDGIVGEGPESDQEMPLADHIEEMVRRLAVVFAVGGLVTLLLFPGGELVNSAFGFNLTSATEVINFLWNRHIPGAPELADRRPRVYGPLELILTELKVAGLAGLIVGLPVFVYETYLFMRPGLYQRERRYYLAAVPTSLVLAVVGMAFAHFVVLPAIFAYFTSYTTGTATVAFGLKETFNLILLLMGYMAIVFQIPLFVMLAIMMNLVTRRWLASRRLIFWGAFLGLSFLVSPDPTGMAPIIIAATMITLFEGTLFLLRWTRME